MQSCNTSISVITSLCLHGRTWEIIPIYILRCFLRQNEHHFAKYTFFFCAGGACSKPHLNHQSLFPIELVEKRVVLGRHSGHHFFSGTKHPVKENSLLGVGVSGASVGIVFGQNGYHLFSILLIEKAEGKASSEQFLSEKFTNTVPV